MNKYIYYIFLFVVFFLSILIVKNNLENIRLRYELEKKQKEVKKAIIKYNEILVKYERAFSPERLNLLSKKHGLELEKMRFININTLNNIIADKKRSCAESTQGIKKDNLATVQISPSALKQ